MLVISDDFCSDRLCCMLLLCFVIADAVVATSLLTSVSSCLCVFPSIWRHSIPYYIILSHQCLSVATGNSKSKLCHLFLYCNYTQYAVYLWYYTFIQIHTSLFCLMENIHSIFKSIHSYSAACTYRTE